MIDSLAMGIIKHLGSSYKWKKEACFWGGMSLLKTRSKFVSHAWWLGGSEKPLEIIWISTVSSSNSPIRWQFNLYVTGWLNENFKELVCLNQMRHQTTNKISFPRAVLLSFSGKLLCSINAVLGELLHLSNTISHPSSFGTEEECVFAATCGNRITSLDSWVHIEIIWHLYRHGNWCRNQSMCIHRQVWYIRFYYIIFSLWFKILALWNQKLTENFSTWRLWKSMCSCFETIRPKMNQGNSPQNPCWKIRKKSMEFTMQNCILGKITWQNYDQPDWTRTAWTNFMSRIELLHLRSKMPLPNTTQSTKIVEFGICPCLLSLLGLSWTVSNHEFS